MKANADKYLLLSGNDSRKITIGNEKISSSKCKKFLDNHLSFKQRTESLCKKASQNINALLAPSMNFEQKRLFVLSTFLNVSQPETKWPH